MNELTIFTSSEFGEIAVLDIGGKPYFPASECAKILGYANPNKAIFDHCKVDGVTKREGVSYTKNQHGKVTEQLVEKNYINEGNLYRLIIRSQLPSAEKFEAWVFDKVLPSIRKNGMYILDELLDDPETLLPLVEKYTAERRARLQAENEAKDLIVELDRSKEWYTVKRVAQMNNISWKDINWSVLKTSSQYMAIEVKRVFDANYTNVNSYHIDVWKKEYPQLRY
ncbi:hypothetical protein FACS1894105_02580 [Clostridia bacterium]|nr:hypothetical protein FACS1894105_02580 [Clostridia bacterium]